MVRQSKRDLGDGRMAPRKYEKRLRAESMEETRRRIIEATYALHSEKGFAATTWKDIAARADVSVGTVYYHFPAIDDLVPACSGFAAEQVPPPGPEVFEGLPTREARVGALVRAFFDHYKIAGQGLANAYRERHKISIVNAVVTEFEKHLRDLLKRAIGDPAPPAPVMKRAEAFADYRVWESFKARGVPQEVIVSTVTTSILTTIREAQSRP